MRHKPLLAFLAASYVFALSAEAQTTAPLTKSLSLPTQTSALKVEGWPQTLGWQKVPDGVGEVVVAPNPAGQEDFLWDTRRFLGTSLGLLFSDAKDQWQIVPALYKQSVRVVGESGGQLWVEQTGQGLVALNRELKVVRRLPDVKGHCIAIESQGFWCLDAFSDRKAKALVEYNADGKEKRRFVVEDFSLVPEAPPVAEKPRTGGGGFGGGGFGGTGGSWGEAISWAQADAEAVWVSINNYHFAGIGGGDAPMTAGETRLGRLDRATGKFTSLPWTPNESETKIRRGTDSYKYNQLLNLPESIQWLTQVDTDTWDVYQLDKHTLQVARVIRLLSPGQSLTTKGDNLWIQTGQTGNTAREARVYSRKDFNPVALRDAGTPPSAIVRDSLDDWDSRSLSGVGILGDDENGIWLNAPSKKLLHAGDDGKLMAYDIGSVLWSSSSRFTPHTPPGQFLRDSNEQLVQIQADGQVKRLSFSGEWLQKGDDVHGYLWFLAATKQRVWYYTGEGQLVTLTPDLSEPREIAPSPLFGDESSFSRHQRVDVNRGSIAVGDDLYAWADSGNLLRINGSSGETSVVESWMKHFANEKSPTSPHLTLTDRDKSAFALPDGRIAFTFSALREAGGFGVYVRRQLDKAHIFLFDPAKDTWKEGATSPSVKPIAAGKRLYGYDLAQLYEWRGDSWTVIAKHPLSTSNERDEPQFNAPSDAKVAGTEKYFYQESAMGLYRVPWAQLGGR